MTTKTLVTAAAVAALMAGAAHAGEKMKKAQAEPTPTPALTDMQSDMSPEARASASPPSVHADTGVSTDASATSAASMATDASAVVATNVVTNGPIADTPENRALYGQPMSRAGKRTAPAGN